MFNILEAAINSNSQIDYFNLWQVSGFILGPVPEQYEFLQVFVCIALVFMLCMFAYSPVLILKVWLDRK